MVKSLVLITISIFVIMTVSCSSASAQKEQGLANSVKYYGNTTIVEISTSSGLCYLAYWSDKMSISCVVVPK